MPTKKYLSKKAKKIMYKGSNCDRKSQLSEILKELLNPRVFQLIQLIIKTTILGYSKMWFTI